MFSKFSKEARKVLTNMQKEMSELRHPYIGTEHLLLSILKYGLEEDKDKLSEYGVTYEVFKKELIDIVGKGSKTSEFYLYTPLLRTVIENAMLISEDKNKSYVDSSDLLIALLEEKEGVAIRILLSLDINIEDLYDEFCTLNIKSASKEKLLLNKFGEVLNNKNIDPVIGREEEIKKIIQILSRRNKNNPLLIGDAGVGKTAIVEEVAKRIEEEKVPENLKNKKIISISMASLVAGTKYRGEFEERVQKIIDELESNENYILFIDEVHTLVGAGGAEGAIDASNILKPALARGKLKLIGATTKEEYKSTIEKDKALSRRFQNVVVEEPTKEVTLNILTTLAPIYENFHNVSISNDNLKLIVDLTDKYIYDRKMPDKAIDILDEVSSKVSISKSLKKNKISVLSDEINNIISLKNNSIINNDYDKALLYKQEEMKLKTKYNKIKASNKELKKIIVKDTDIKLVVEEKTGIPIINKKINLLDNKKIIGQDNAIYEINKLLKKIKLGFRKQKPYSFLFVGPTGVGKTYLAKEIAKNLSSIDNLIRLDMSEYRESHSISKIIGSPPGYVGYDEGKNIFQLVKEKPYSVILLDEIEKGSNEVINLFLQILDEGKAKNSSGELIRFDNTIIIMTSNISYNTNEIGFNNKENKTREKEIKDILGTPLINRIDKVLYFNNLTKEDIIKVIKLKLNILKDKYKKENVNITINKSIVDDILNASNFSKYGARKIDKIIDSYVDNFIIDEMIKGSNNIRVNHIDMEVV